jgi:E3 ubiquitin-protein ligase RNF216
VFGAGSLGIDRQNKKQATEILCCSGDCTSGFQDALLRKVLPIRTWEKYCELQHIAIAERAGLGEEMSICSKCGFRAFVPETQMLFECPIKDCMFVSCKKCGKEPHIPLRCDEVVQKQRQDEGRLKIEEALSEAKMRTCPKCKQKFIKEDGCNKVREPHWTEFVMQWCRLRQLSPPDIVLLRIR